MPDPKQGLLREVCRRQFGNRTVILKRIGTLARAWRSGEIDVELATLTDHNAVTIELATNVVDNKPP